MLFRFRYSVAGGHTHVRVFAGEGAASLALCGHLAFRNEEFEHLRAGIERTIGTQNGIGHEVEFLEER